MTALADLGVFTGWVMVCGLAVLAGQLLVYFILQYTRPTIAFYKLKNDRTGDVVFLIRNFDAVRYHDTLRVMLEPLDVVAQVSVHAGPHCPDPPVAEPSAERISIKFKKIPAEATFSIRVRRKDTRSVKLHLHPGSELVPRRFKKPLPHAAAFHPIGHFGIRFVVGLGGFVLLFWLGLDHQDVAPWWSHWPFIVAGILLAGAVFALVVPAEGKPTVAGYLGWNGASKDWFAEPPPAKPVLARPLDAEPARAVATSGLARPGEPGARSDVLIVLALAEEHNPFRRYVDLVHHTAPLDHWRGVVTTKSGAPRTITLVVQKEMGGIEAAVLTTRAIALLHPRAVMMSGIMGGFAAQSVAYGDVVIALQSVNYSFGKLTTTTAADGTTTEEMQRRLSIQPLRGQLAARVHAWITADRDQHGRSSFLARIRPGLLGVTNVPEPFGSRIHFGSIASGPLVVASESFIANLQRTIDDKLLGVEMEIHGVMHAGHADELPTIGIKAVVDHADARKGLSSAEADAAHAFAPHASAQLCLQLIRDDVIAMK